MFTPGPWRVVQRSNNYAHWILNEKDLCIGEVYEAPPTFHINGKANAALISTAPELYAAVEKLIQLLAIGHIHWVGDSPHILAMREEQASLREWLRQSGPTKVLAKARGEKEIKDAD